jgi:hypothetical protein
VVLRGEDEDIDVCMTDPGHPVTVTVTARLRTLVDVLMGTTELGEALRGGSVVVDGESAAIRRFGSWFEFGGSGSFAGGG